MRDILRQLETATLLEDLATSQEYIENLEITDNHECYEYHYEMITRIKEVLHNRGELK